jgi:hypothetical protein
MTEILRQYETITLDEMRDIRLMNRIDTKFVTTMPVLRQLLMLARDEYYVQQVDGEVVAPYYTLYYDTEDCAMYNRHEAGHLVRQKIRVRSYLHVGLNFLEVKTKNNHGRTKKKRIEVTDMSLMDAEKRMFLEKHLHYGVDTLQPAINNHFRRITLVNRGKTERLTIDSDLRFHNLVSGIDKDMGDLVIIELKRDGQVFSPVLEMLRQLRIHPHGFSKYCMGSALTNPQLPVNRFKTKLRDIDIIMNIKH